MCCRRCGSDADVPDRSRAETHAAARVQRRAFTCAVRVPPNTVLTAVALTIVHVLRCILSSAGFDLPRYTGMIDCVTQMVKTEGIMGLYKGMVPCWLKVCSNPPPPSPRSCSSLFLLSFVLLLPCRRVS